MENQLSRVCSVVIQLQCSHDFGKSWENVGGRIVGVDPREVANNWRLYAVRVGIKYVRVVRIETVVLLDLSPIEDDENGK